MTLIAINTFQGEIPRAEKHLLPDTSAQYALNVDTRSGSLRTLAGTSPVGAVTAAVKSLYTENGITFFTWPTDVDAHKSQVIGDVQQRVYFTDGSGYYGTLGSGMTAAGGPPITAWKMGVPAPVIALNSIVNATSWPDGVSITASFFYESGGVKTQEASISITQIGSDVGRVYQFTPPARDVGAEVAAQTVTAIGYYVYAGWQPTFFDTPELVTIISATGIQTQSQGVVYAAQVITQNVKPAIVGQEPGLTVLDVSQLFDDTKTTGKTNSTATGVLQIVGKKGTETVFTLYSEGSSFVRADQPARVLLKQIQDTSTYEATIEWGANGVLGSSVSKKDAAYVATLINVYGEESGPSLPIIATSDYLQKVRIAVTVPAVGSFAGFSKIRIYETVTGSRDTAYHLALESAPATSGVFDVANALSSIGVTLETIGWDVPPDGLSGLQPLPFGAYAAFKANELYVTEQYRFHAMPSKYVMSFPNAIKTIKSTAFGLIVVTTAQGYLVTGMSPDSMQKTELPVRCSVVGKRAITTHGNIAFFASEDGIVMVQGTSATLEPWQRLFTREEWRLRYSSAELAELTLASHDGYLVGFLQGGGFLLRLDEAAGEFIQHTIPANGAFVLPQTDGLYIGTNSGIKQFGSGQRLTGEWTSKEFTLIKPLNFGVIELCGAGSATYTLYSNGDYITSGTVALKAAGAMQRLPSGYKTQRVQLTVSLVGDSYLTRIALAETPSELANV